jgi:hypothetical protein
MKVVTIMGVTGVEGGRVVLLPSAAESQGRQNGRQNDHLQRKNLILCDKKIKLLSKIKENLIGDCYF